MSETLSISNTIKIGADDINGPKTVGYESYVISLMVLFCIIKILSNYVLQADPQASIAYIIWE